MVRNRQVRVLMEMLGKGKSLIVASAKADMDEKTARKYRVLSASLSSAKNPIKISRILYFFNPGADDSIQRAG